jgi:hypothetical protein
MRDFFIRAPPGRLFFAFFWVSAQFFFTASKVRRTGVELQSTRSRRHAAPSVRDGRCEALRCVFFPLAGERPRSPAHRARNTEALLNHKENKRLNDAREAAQCDGRVRFGTHPTACGSVLQRKKFVSRNDRRASIRACRGAMSRRHFFYATLP